MAFHEVRFPVAVSHGSLGGPERRTEIVTLANGFEERNSPWAHSRRRYDAGIGLRSVADVEALIAFFEARRGQLHAFRWKDWSDFKSCALRAMPAADDQFLGTADGESATFQLRKLYGTGPASYWRPIRKPVPGSVRVQKNGTELVENTDFAVDEATGLVTLAEVPPDGTVIAAGFEFDVPVRFDTDYLRTSIATFDAGEIPNVPIVEVRV
ncbi:uncharacterized protein (TIGR02217 family) [Palleronia aestuarii]|uniref:Uncharacterized protein (TIGR02217 family) n=1 Tax=Palleronia aestuarii TaxID=568105 RepID=A0A2W7NHK6_9RHOB|nr:DUF2460 domain-containing protein [Palleronia aestuarii]PZX17707.1 uncharacterized protein (TIGR02217 family) [Palleronia aestuarii]